MGRVKNLDIPPPNPKQQLFFKARARYNAYGGARAGGKSWAMRVKFVNLCLRYAGIQILLLRRTLPELTENHVNPLLILLKGIAKYNKQEKVFAFPNGARLKLGYCANEADVLQYQGQAYDVIGMEEATMFTEFQFNCLRESNRSSGLMKETFAPRMYLTCNPGGVGHHWVKRLFVDKVYKDKERPEDYVFIPARVYDNTAFMERDPDYVAQLESLPEKRRKMMLHGDWSSVEGAFFEEFVNDPTHYEDRQWTHVIAPFEPKRSWNIYRSFDFGYNKPFSVGYWTVDEDGIIYRILEWYGCTENDNESIEVDWYYKKNTGGRTVLHYVKYVNDEVLFATENDPNFAERGWYDHGMYPFVFDPLFRVEGSPTGFGYIDVGKDSQSYIDRGNQAIMQNMLANAKPRHFIRTDGAVNEEEYADTTKDFIHVDGNLGQDSILPVQGKPLNDIYVQVINNKIDELKETTGNRDVATGGTTGGVTAASALAAMQEGASRLDRDNGKGAYRAYRKVCLMVIELIRQFYDMPRKFRILGENGAARFVQYSNEGIVPQHQGFDLGMDMGYRLPLFDIEVTAQKASPYSKMSQNELALQFFGAGFFNPQIADQALACLDMMDFDRKQFVMQRIAENGGMYQQMMAMQQQMLMLAQMVDQSRGTSEIAPAIATQFGMEAPMAPMGGGADTAKRVEETEALGGNEKKEASTTKKARQRVAESTNPT